MTYNVRGTLYIQCTLYIVCDVYVMCTWCDDVKCIYFKVVLIYTVYYTFISWYVICRIIYLFNTHTYPHTYKYTYTYTYILTIEPCRVTYFQTYHYSCRVTYFQTCHLSIYTRYILVTVLRNIHYIYISTWFIHCNIHIIMCPPYVL